MSRITIIGTAAVFREDDPVTTPDALRSLDGLVYDEERFTDYLGGTPEEDALAAALKPGGALKFRYASGAALLTAETEYRSRRPLTDQELKMLRAHTLGQWSDGIGENWVCESAAVCGFTIMCLTQGDDEFEDATVEVRVELD